MTDAVNPVSYLKGLLAEPGLEVNVGSAFDIGIHEDFVLVTNDMSGIVAHNLSGLGWSPLEVTDEMDRDATGDPEDAI